MRIFTDSKAESSLPERDGEKPPGFTEEEVPWNLCQCKNVFSSGTRRPEDTAICRPELPESLDPEFSLLWFHHDVLVDEDMKNDVSDMAKGR